MYCNFTNEQCDLFLQLDFLLESQNGIVDVWAKSSLYFSFGRYVSKTQRHWCSGSYI